MKNSFKKAERLCSRKTIKQLFVSGNTLVSFPFKIVWQEMPLHENYPVNVAISVPKHTFKRAVDRNLLKRRIKEAYRNNKHDLYQHLTNKNAQLGCMIIYLGKNIVAYQEMEEELILTLQQLIKHHEVASK